jgi:serpin B
MKKYIRTLIGFTICLPAMILGSESLSTSINYFATDFYQESLAASNENELFSPYCIFNCLSMAYIGSAGITEMEIAKALGWDQSQEDLAKSLKDMAVSLNSRTNSYKLNIANSAWVDQRTTLLPSYRTLIQNEFLADVQSLNFRHSTECAGIINNWVKEQTNNTIPRLLAPQDISSDTQLMLVSALYFKGSWVLPFKKTNTRQETFYTGPAKSKKVPMMSQSAVYSYYEDSAMQCVFIPFKGDMSFFVLLPRRSLNEVERLFLDLPIDEIIASSSRTRLNIKLPSFDMRIKYDLIPALKDLGIREIFSSRANLSKINGKFDLYVNKALHEAYFSLNEEGVTASAATAIGAGTTCIKIDPPAKDFIANHPFIFGIVDLKSNVMLFLGKMKEP